MAKMIKERENALFLQWKARYHEQGLGFVTDGVFNEEEYLNAAVRIVFVLKEAVDESRGNWDLREEVGDGKHGYTWSNITRWTKAIHGNETNHVTWNDINSAGKAERRNALSKIVAINLKKSPGGASSDMDVINEMAEQNICKQIALYEPDLVVCCGSRVADILASIIFKVSDCNDVPMNPRLQWQVTDRNVWYYDGAPSGLFSSFTPFVAFNHPQARISSDFLAFALLDAWRFIKNKHGILLENC